MTIGSFPRNDGSGGWNYYYTGQEEECENARCHHMLQEAQSKLRNAEPALQSATWKLTEATKNNQKLMADYAAQAAYDDRVLAEAIAFHKLRTEQRVAAEAAAERDSAVELEQLQRCVVAAESVKADCEAGIADARAGFVAIQEAKKEAARAAEREKWARQTAAAEAAARRAAEERAAAEARRVAAAAAELERQAAAERARLQKISLFAIRIEGTDEEAEAVLAHLGPGRIYVSFKKNTMLAFQAINRFSTKYGLTQSQAEQVLRE